MFVFENFLVAVAQVLNMVLEIYKWVVIVAVLISWVNPDPYNTVVRFLNSMTDPVFGFVRDKLPRLPLPIDISPIIVLCAIVFLQTFLVQTLMDIARSGRQALR